MTRAGGLTHPDIPGLTYVRDIGAGGYADVYLYEQAITEQQVAVKVLSGDLSDDVIRRFTAEANTMAGLDHPYIVQVFQAALAADGRPYLVMKYYPRPNLAVRARADRMSVTEVLSVGIKVACAVETAHQAGILHRDIKPANILTNKFGEPGLTDFGIATTTADATEQSDGLSIPWAPPEVLAGTFVDARADVYALGATLWHLLVGRSPFEDPGGDNSALAMVRRIKQSPAPGTRRLDVPAALDRLLVQAMAKDPGHRPQTALALAQALQGIEVAERWNPTPLTVLGDALERVAPGDVVEVTILDDTTHPGASADEGERTRLRSPQRVQPQHVEPPAPSPFAPPEPAVATSATVRRPSSSLPSGVADSRTVQRTPSPSPATPPEAVVNAPAGRSRRVVLAAAGIAVAVVVGIGVLLTAGGGGHGAAATTGVEQTTPDQDPFGGQAPGPGLPVVTGAVSSPGTVQFSWTYSGQEAGDDFRWRRTGGEWVLAATPSATVQTTPGQAVCIEVQVQRADGSAQSPVSDVGCAG